MSALSELLTQANANGLSTQKITDMMRGQGHDIGKDTVWKYMSGRHTIVQTKYLQAFVDTFPALRLADLQRAAGIPPELGPWEPPAQAEMLTGKERRALNDLITSMIAERQKVGVPLLAVVEDHQDEPSRRRAARSVSRRKGNPTVEDAQAAAEASQERPDGNA